MTILPALFRGGEPRPRSESVWTMAKEVLGPSPPHGTARRAQECAMPASTVGSPKAASAWRWRSPRLVAERVAQSPTLMQQAGIADRRPDFCHSLAYPSRVSSGLTAVRSVGENGMSSAAAMMTPVQRAWHGTGGSPSSVESDHMPVARPEQSPANGAPRTGGSSSSAESDHMPVAHMTPRQPVPQPPGCAGTTEHAVGEGKHMLIPLLYAT